MNNGCGDPIDWYPNVGKSALINRLTKSKACASAPRPGVTRNLRWVRVGGDLDLLDSPGVLPPRLADQRAAARLAMANDIGEASYLVRMRSRMGWDGEGGVRALCAFKLPFLYFLFIFLLPLFSRRGVALARKKADEGQ